MSGGGAPPRARVRPRRRVRISARAGLSAMTPGRIERTKMPHVMALFAALWTAVAASSLPTQFAPGWNGEAVQP